MFEFKLPKMVRMGHSTGKFLSLLSLSVLFLSLHIVAYSYANPDIVLSVLSLHILVAHCVSKWFYNISPSTATRAAHGGSLIGGTKAIHAQGVSYEGTRWIQGFTWFGPPECNTLRPRENGNCIAVCTVQL
jgi:hypothetical protein